MPEINYKWRHEKSTINYKLVFFFENEKKNTRNKNMKTCENYVKDVINYKL